MTNPHGHRKWKLQSRLNALRLTGAAGEGGHGISARSVEVAEGLLGDLNTV